MVGGQVQIIRAALRYKRVVCPVGRRSGKTTLRPFLWALEQSMTKGVYYAAIATSGHVKGWESYKFAKEQFGDLVLESHGEPENQDRWLKLKPLVASNVVQHAPALTNDPVVGPRIAANFGKNEGAQIWFFSGAHPHYLSIQGYTHHFNRFDLDECHQLHPGILRVVNPMLLDSGGSMLATGIPDIDSPGNDWFHSYYEKGLDPEKQHRWHSISFPSYANPHLDKEALAEIQDDVLTNDDFDQQIMARFVTGSGAVFTNLDAVFVLKATQTRTQATHFDLPTWIVDLLKRTHSDAVKAWVYEGSPKSGHQYAATIDFAGRTKTRDATVIGIFNMTECYQACVIQIMDMPSPDQLAWCEGVKKQYDCGEVHGDNTPEGSALMSYLRERFGTGIIGHNFSASNKPVYVRRLQYLFEMSEVRLIDCREQRQEFQKFRRIAGESKEGRDTTVSYSHPPNGHDDFVASALMIAPSMAHGRRAEAVKEAPIPEVIDDAGKTSLALWGNGRVPWAREDADDAMSLRDVVLPRRR